MNQMHCKITAIMVAFDFLFSNCASPHSLLKNKKKMIYLFMLLGVTGIFSSCKKEPLDIYECTNSEYLSFNDQIFPILKLSCMNGTCHGKFDDYDYVKKYVNNKKLLGSIQHKKGYSSMPKNEDKLPDSIIIKISCWIQNGAPEN